MRFGIDHEHEHYKWWVLSCTSLGMLLATINSGSRSRDTLLSIFSGLASGLSDAAPPPFIASMHAALWVLAASSLLGAGVSLLRLRHGRQPVPAAAPPREARA